MLIDIHAVSILNPYDHDGFPTSRPAHEHVLHEIRIPRLGYKGVETIDDKLPECLTYTPSSCSEDLGSKLQELGDWELFPYSFQFTDKTIREVTNSLKKGAFGEPL